MSALVRTSVDAARVVGAIDDSDFARLLGMPRGRPLEGAIAERAAGARSWYASQGRPRILSRRAEVEAIERDGVRLQNGRRLDGGAIAQRLHGGRAHAALAVAVTAGPEVDAETERLWATGLPDEAYFLDRLATAVVEKLVAGATLHLCRESSVAGETAIPHLSPGCGAWELAAQHELWRWLAEGAAEEEIEPFSILESAMLKPKLSILAVVGLTRIAGAAGEVGCRSCDLPRCAFRRAPYGRAA